MSKKFRTEMTIEEFELNLVRFGCSLDQWPVYERDQAWSLLERSITARQLLANNQGLEQLLQQDVAHIPVISAQFLQKMDQICQTQPQLPNMDDQLTGQKMSADNLHDTVQTSVNAIKTQRVRLWQAVQQGLEDALSGIGLRPGLGAQLAGLACVASFGFYLGWATAPETLSQENSITVAAISPPSTLENNQIAMLANDMDATALAKNEIRSSEDRDIEEAASFDVATVAFGDISLGSGMQFNFE